MGYYIETGDVRDKASAIIRDHGAVEISREEAEALIDDDSVAVVCVMVNPRFEAAGFVYDRNELAAFTEPDDARPRTWLRMDRQKAKELSGYNR